MRDYYKPASLAKRASYNLWFLIFTLLVIVIWLAVQVWHNASLPRHYKRILLYNSVRPVAIVDFWPVEQQVFVVDLLNIANLDFANKLQQQLTIHSASSVYSFVLGMLFDQSFLVEDLDPSQEEAVKKFLKQQDSQLLSLIDNDQLWWRTESLEGLQSRKQKQQFNCPVAVINATSASGLAANFSAMIERSQFAVIRKANLSEDYPLSQVIYDDSNVDCQNLLQRLSTFAEFQVNSQQQSLLGEYRAKMVIILGEDLAGLHALLVDFL